MKTINLPLFESQKDENGNIMRYKRLDNGEVISPDNIKILNILPTAIIYHEENPVIKMKRRLLSRPEANGLVRGEKILGEGINPLYTASYCKRV